MSYVDYIGRSVDLAIYDGPFSRTVPQVMGLALPGESGRLITGIRKLCQRFVILLMTPLGSILHLPDEGCDFLSQLLQGQLRTQLDVYAAFSSSVSQIREQLLQKESDETPDDERLSTARIESLSLAADQISMTIVITSLDGSREVIPPLTIGL